MKIKNIITVLFLSVSCLAFAGAQETGNVPAVKSQTQIKNVTLATVNIYHATSTQKGNAFSISFDLANRVGIQPGVKYGVMLVKDGETSQSIVDEHVYDEVLNLGENTSLHKRITYTAPSYLDGNFLLILSSKNISGFPFSQVALGKVGLTKSTSSSLGTIINVTSCYLTVVGEKGQPHYMPMQGVDITVNEALESHCSIKNTSSGQVTVSPSFVTRARSSFGDVVQAEGGDVTGVMLLPGEEKLITTLLPKVKAPQSYNVGLRYGPVGNEVLYHYVVSGGSGTVQNIIFDKNVYSTGETAKISFVWSASADSFANSRLGTSTKLIAPSFSVTLTDENGKVCAQPFTQKLNANDTLVHVTASITSSCFSPKASFTLLDSSLGSLSELSVTTRTKDTAAAPEIKDSSTSSKIMMLVSIALLLLIGVALFIYKRRKIDTEVISQQGGAATTQGAVVNPPVSVLLVVIASSILLSGVGRSYADTFNAYDSNGNKLDVAVTLDSPSYAPGATISINASTNYGGCGNWDIGVTKNLMVNIDGDSQKSVFNGTAKHIGGGTTKTAPATTGSHNANFTMFINSSNGGEYAYPFTVNSAPSPTVDIHFGFLDTVKDFISNFSINKVFAAETN